MKRIFTLRFMLISLFAAMGMAMNAGIIEYTDGDFKYSLDTETKTAELARYYGSATEVTIPESVTHDDVTYSVTSLGDWCFSGCKSLTSITIPSSVTSIGDNCFYNCSSLTSIDIPSSVTSLGNSCFSYCRALTSIIVDENNPVYDSRENCNAIIETESNTMITGYASTVIPSSVTSLGDDCFSGCSSLTSIRIPSLVTSLGANCFDGCSSLTSIIIPESVTSLGHFCFDGCSSLTSISIPSSVSKLGYACFYGCSALTSIDIPYSVTSLGTGCFCECSSLTSIDIPSSVTSIGEYCFAYCTSLSSIIVDENNPVYDSRENCNAIIETESNTMITGCASTVIPSSVTSLGEVCFYGCSALTSIDIPSSVTSLGTGCFCECTSLTSINIPSSVTRLGGFCFDWCVSLQTMICEIPTAKNGYFFGETPIYDATLYVPESSLLSYQSTSPWSSFGTILPISPDGIGEIATDGEAGIDAIYNLEGKRCNGTNRGLNIIRMSDGTTRKVLK